VGKWGDNSGGFAHLGESITLYMKEAEAHFVHERYDSKRKHKKVASRGILLKKRWKV